MADATSSRIKVAFGSVPKDGGTFTFYRNIRKALSERGIDLFCVTLGRPQCQLWDDAFADEACIKLAPRARTLKSQAQAFTRWCENNEIDVVMGINSEGILSALPHLPKRIRVMSRCANAFDHGYKITMSGRERLAKIIALTPRLKTDLTTDYGADPDKVVLIPNGIEQDKFAQAAAMARGQKHHLEIGFLGRLEHVQKGVMYIPEIVAGLQARDIPFRLRIAGRGKDQARLEAAMQSAISTGHVKFIGAIGPAEVPVFLGESDVYLFTSHFEGCPNALLEAMMAGCVPVSGIIEGITDFLIDDGVTGFLSPLGDPDSFADHIARLHGDRERLALLSKAVATQARARFTDTRAADAYTEVFQQIMTSPPPDWEPLAWNDFKPDPNFPNYWRHNIPPVVKSLARRLRR